MSSSFEHACALDELEEGATRRVELAGEPICLVRLSGDEVRAVHNTCSHQEYPLDEGWVEIDDRSIECALHGSMFDLDTGSPDSLPAVRPIPTYAVEVRDGTVWVDATRASNDAPVPRH